MMGNSHPLLEQLAVALRGHVPELPVSFEGQWLESSRRTYQRKAQIGSGTGPYEDVVDLRWQGALTAREPVGGMAFLLTGEELHWVKTPAISPVLPVDISLSAYADYRTGQATFTAHLDGAYLPGLPVPIGPNLPDACAIERTAVETGRVTRLARASDKAFFVLLLPGGTLKMGRKRLWHLRDDVAGALAPDVRELLTHRRSGSVLLRQP
jgi:hypothetical protein